MIIHYLPPHYLVTNHNSMYWHTLPTIIYDDNYHNPPWPDGYLYWNMFSDHHDLLNIIIWCTNIITWWSSWSLTNIIIWCTNIIISWWLTIPSYPRMTMMIYNHNIIISPALWFPCHHDNIMSCHDNMTPSRSCIMDVALFERWNSRDRRKWIFTDRPHWFCRHSKLYAGTVPRHYKCGLDWTVSLFFKCCINLCHFGSIILHIFA